MSNAHLSPGENVILNSHGSVIKPIQGHGHLYLTHRRLLLIQRSGLLRVREAPVLDIEIPQISYVKIEGMLRRILVLGVKAGNGQVVPYRIRVAREEKWHSEIDMLKNGAKKSPTYPEESKEAGRFCGLCGVGNTIGSNFCSNCGEFFGGEEDTSSKTSR